MPLKKSAYKGRTKPLTVPFDGEDVGITYYPARFTPNDARLKADGDEDATVAFLARMLATADITDDHGKPVPVTREELSDWGYDLLIALSRAIVADISPKSEAG